MSYTFSLRFSVSSSLTAVDNIIHPYSGRISYSIVTLLLTFLFYITVVYHNQSIMASQRGAKTLLEMYPHLKQGIEWARRDILGHIPKTSDNSRTGYNRSIQQLTGVYLKQYYQEPIDKYARMVRIWLFKIHEEIPKKSRP